MVLTSDESIKAAEELFQGLGKALDSFTNKVEKANKSSSFLTRGFEKLSNTTKSAIKNFFSFDNVIKQVKDSMQFATEVNSIAETIGAPTEEVSAWVDAVGNVTDFKKSIDSLATIDKDVLKGLGFSMLDSTGKTKNLLDILPEIANRMENMSKLDSFILGKKLGLGDETIALLQQGNQAVEKTIQRQKELGTASFESAFAFQEFNDAMKTIDHLIRTVAMKIGTLILPALTSLLNKVASFVEFLINNEGVMIAVISGIAAALITILLPAIAAILTAASPIIFTAVAIGIAVAAVVALLIGAFKLLRATYQWLVAIVSQGIEKLIDGHSKLVAKVVGYIQAIVDIYNYLAGKVKDTVENIVNAFRWLVSKATDGIEAIINSFNTLCGVLSFVVGFFEYCFGVIASIVASIIVLFTEGPKEAIQYLSNALAGVFDGFFEKFPKVKQAFDSLGGKAANWWDKNTAWLGWDSGVEETGRKAIEPTLIKGSNAISSAQKASQVLSGSNSQPVVTNNRQISYRNNFNITSDNPERVGRIVDEKMRAMSQDAGEYFNDGRLA